MEPIRISFRADPRLLFQCGNEAAVSPITVWKAEYEHRIRATAGSASSTRGLYN